jgi:hypothetical protein
VVQFFQPGAKMPTTISRHHRKAKVLLLAALLQVGLCSPSWSADNPFPESSAAYTKLQELKERAAELSSKAMGLLGINYKRGGNTPENGLDCSGFVRYVFKDVLSAELPRTSAEISKVGEKIEQKDLQPGDLVFYNTLKRGFSHVGIYLGDNKFIHSPSAGGQVRIESMDIAYWKKRFNGARRISDDDNKDDKDKK